MGNLTYNIGILSDGSLNVTNSDNGDVLIHDFPIAWDNALITLHDYQTAENDYKPRKSATHTEVPETLHLSPIDHIEVIELDRELQEFYLSVLRIGSPSLTREDAILRWHELTRTSVCFTDNGASWDQGKADYLFDPNSTLPPMGFKISIATCGNAFKSVTGNIIEAIDYRQRPLPDPVELYREQPWKFFWCTQAYMEKTGKKELIDGAMRTQYTVSRFPQFRPVGTLLPLMGTDGATRISERWRYTEIEKGTIYSPYVP